MGLNFLWRNKISTASQEQGNGIAQVNSMMEQAMALAGSVSTFKWSDEVLALTAGDTSRKKLHAVARLRSFGIKARLRAFYLDLNAALSSRPMERGNVSSET